jgi:hypothetical protein
MNRFLTKVTTLKSEKSDIRHSLVDCGACLEGDAPLTKRVRAVIIQLKYEECVNCT